MESVNVRNNRRMQNYTGKYLVEIYTADEAEVDSESYLSGYFEHGNGD
ncbi:MAG: hypothetical protein LVQ96_08660 [Thermoplasmatales archaeon]|nr:hypothetical protein [Thermoplasmatales archaeon]